MSERLITISAAAVMRADGQTLLVRKRGTTAFMQPGGKQDPGETPVEALLRELREELGLVIAPQDAQPMGRIAAPAANEPGWRVEADLFRVMLDGAVPEPAPEPANEIAEILWIDPANPPPVELAPLTRDQVLPLLVGP